MRKTVFFQVSFCLYLFFRELRVSCGYINTSDADHAEAASTVHDRRVPVVDRQLRFNTATHHYYHCCHNNNNGLQKNASSLQGALRGVAPRNGQGILRKEVCVCVRARATSFNRVTRTKSVTSEGRAVFIFALKRTCVRMQY